MKYIGIDGDNTGAQLELFFLENNEKGVQSFSQSVDGSLLKISRSLEALGIEVIFRSGDSILCKADNLDFQKLSHIMRENSDHVRFSVGIGCTLRDTYIALKYAKVSGKNKIILLEKNTYKTL